jgi:MIP family channel proteins
VNGITLGRRAVAEGVGTFFLVFAGCGAVVTDATRDGALGTLGIAAVFGLVLVALIATLGHISGAHFNPAVSFSFFLTRHLPARDLGAYVTAQLAGATAAALALLAVWTGAPAELGATVPSVGLGAAVLYEALMSFLLMLVIISVATDTRAVGAPAAIAIGATVALDAAFGGPLTGASMNPARSLGPALASGTWTDIWVYLVGPLLGAPLGALVYQYMRGEHPGNAPLEADLGDDAALSLDDRAPTTT